MPRSPSPRTRSEHDRRELIGWAVACAERVLPLFAQANPADRRPREALDGALAFSRGELRVGAARELAFACHAAAREAGDPAAIAAARACGQAVSVAHMASHARGAAVYALKAVTLALPGEADAAAAEEAWQRAHVPERFRTFVYPDNQVGA